MRHGWWHSAAQDRRTLLPLRRPGVRPAAAPASGSQQRHVLARRRQARHDLAVSTYRESFRASGKIDTTTGEGPHECAVREIREETGIKIAPDELRLLGIVSERAYEGDGHWLIFLFEALRPVSRGELAWSEFDEGVLEWKRLEEVPDLPIPKTDREVMWPLVQSHRSGFFSVHIDWADDGITWTVHESHQLSAGGVRPAAAES